MTNDINGVPPSGLASVVDVTGSRNVSSEKPDSGQSQSNVPAQSRETVALTDSARLLQKVEVELSNASDVDISRVETLKNAVASGSYEFDDRAVADKLLRSDAERSS
ncbi:MAG: flagellar biosynthesis anti-sigma factor FlgM [Woeseiaceae bacterium]